MRTGASIPGGAPEHSRAVRVAAWMAMLFASGGLTWAGGLWLPGSLAFIAVTGGHLYSYAMRGEPPGGLSRFVLSGLLLAAFAWMVGDLVTAFAGGILPQGQFGMAAQAITSFRLRTRRDLYASLVHSLLLLYIAADVAYSPWLLLFLLGFAVSSLAVFSFASAEDYQRAAGMRLRAARLGGLWKVLLPGFVSVLAVGVLLFFGMPRLGSNQMVTAATAAVPLPSALRGQTVTPVFPFVALTASGQTGAAPQMDLGFRGRPSYETVLYVRSQVRSYWRGLTFERYDGQRWESALGPTRLRRGARGGFEVDLPPSAAEGAQFVQTFTVVKDQPDTVFTGYWAEAVQYPDTLLFRRGDGEGDTLLAREALRARMSYTVLSRQPRHSEERLLADRAVHPDPRYISLPPLTNRVRAAAADAVAGAQSDYERAVALEAFLRAGFPYDLNVPPLPEGWEAVDRFMFEDRRGFCQQFATAMAIMGRVVGLPTRIATGYLPGRYDPISGAFEVRAADAHSWVEVYFREYGWVPFDPTPEVGGAAREQPAVTWLIGNWEGPTFGDLGMAVGAGAGALSGGLAMLSGVAGILAALAAGALVVPLVVFSLLRLWRARDPFRGRLWRPRSPRDRVLERYRALEGALASAGVDRRSPWETPAEHLQRASGRLMWKRAEFIVVEERLTSAVYSPGTLDPNTAADVAAAIDRAADLTERSR